MAGTTRIAGIPGPQAIAVQGGKGVSIVAGEMVPNLGHLAANTPLIIKPSTRVPRWSRAGGNTWSMVLRRCRPGDHDDELPGTPMPRTC